MRVKNKIEEIPMNRYMVSASVLVLGVAGVKTALMASLVLPSENFSLAMISGLFALFTVLTAGVAYIAYKRISSFLEGQRKSKLAPGGGDTASKDTVMHHYAAEWGLSKAEAEVALFAAKGFSNNEIAVMRGSSVPTVKSQLSNIYQKSKLDSRYQLIAFVTDEVCEMATDAAEPAADLVPQRDNVTPLVKKASRAVSSTKEKPFKTVAAGH